MHLGSATEKTGRQFEIGGTLVAQTTLPRVAFAIAVLISVRYPTL